VVSVRKSFETAYDRERSIFDQRPELVSFHPAHTTKEARANSYRKLFSRLKIHEPQDQKDPRVESLIKKTIAFYTSQKYSQWRISPNEIDWLVKNMRQKFNNPDKIFNNINFHELLDWYKKLLTNNSPNNSIEGLGFLKKLRTWEGDSIKQKFGMGNFNEFRTEIALRHLLTQGFISSYFRSPNSSAYDHIGIDFLIEFEHNNKKFILPLQIKSSKNAVDEYYGSHKNINALCATNLSISEKLKTLKAIINFNIKKDLPVPKVLSDSIKGLKPGDKVRLLSDAYRKHRIADYEVRDLAKKALAY
jgi:hypothetical protein